MCRETRMAVAAAQLAIADAGFAEKPMDPEMSGVVFGSDYMLTMPEDYSLGMKTCASGWRIRVCEVGQRRFERHGSAVDAQVSAQHAGESHRDLQRLARAKQFADDARGGGEPGDRRSISDDSARAREHDGGRRRLFLAVCQCKRSTPLQTEQMAAENCDPTKASRPFDKGRTGMVAGEGAGMVMLEELSSARAQGSDDLCRSLGAGPRECRG